MMTSRPAERRRVTGADLLAAADLLPHIDVAQFFADLDRYVDPDPLHEPEHPAQPPGRAGLDDR